MVVKNDWIWQKQECEGDYFFNGKHYATKEVSEALTPEQISEIITDVQQAVSKNMGLDYLQVFKNEKEQKIFVVDQLSKEVLESGKFSKGDNYVTVLFSEEY